jgi:acyl transferase domain-containing protein
MLSARDADELRDIANRMSRYLQQNPLTQLGDIAYTLQQRSQKGQIRWAKVAATTSQLQIALDELSKTKQLAPASNEQLPRVAFVFTNDEEWDSDFASDLLARSNNYRQICESAEQLAAAHGTFNDAEIALFANQFATAEMLRQLGIAPDVICGYGTGDYAAACISGAITFSDAVDLLRHRTTLLKSLNLRTIHGRARLAVFHRRGHCRGRTNNQRTARSPRRDPCRLGGRTHRLSRHHDQQATPLAVRRACHGNHESVSRSDAG